jgi:transcriptional regulator with XRE-family HTH domain
VKILAALETFDELIAVMRDRRISMGLSQNALEDRAGLTGGYVGKLEGSRGKSNSRSIGRESLPLLLGALGLELAVVPADACRKQAYAVCAVQEGVGHGLSSALSSFLSMRAQLGGDARAAKLTAERRRKIARDAATARWAKVRKEKAKVRRNAVHEAPVDPDKASS